MPRFTVLLHDSPRGLHYDLLLETGDVLRTWALPQPPDVAVEMACEALPDHRLHYLEYEGPVSDGRGTVAQWDRGTYEIQRQGETELAVKLAGEKLVGQAVLQRSSEDPQSWQFSFRRD
ncbi:MAG: hypothetical protein HQ567_28990 [Candidatus Nealsonbacteria bacterium]|nr:hypothetical protein [Candidatus Nealsonbacteria bacterium]